MGEDFKTAGKQGITGEVIRRIASLYGEMDRAYAEFAGEYQLDCAGCRDNCCTQRFYHYTLAEYIFLLEGLKKIPFAKRDLIIKRARVVVGSYAHEAQAGEIFKLMCPANFEGLCALYFWRPMICRLHGVPNFFTMPGGETKESGGCAVLAEKHKQPGRLLDRTPFYSALAAIEKDLRQGLGFRQKLRRTTAQMILDMALELDVEGEFSPEGGI
ncbi:MAG: hypothetical protein M0018_10990 [Nitrospiraceae bacterium]|nr:hypothetical protein [Nitrospiraceae bacterium]